MHRGAIALAAAMLCHQAAADECFPVWGCGEIHASKPARAPIPPASGRLYWCEEEDVNISDSRGRLISAKRMTYESQVGAWKDRLSPQPGWFVYKAICLPLDSEKKNWHLTVQTWGFSRASINNLTEQECFGIAEKIRNGRLNPDGGSVEKSDIESAECRS